MSKGLVSSTNRPTDSRQSSVQVIQSDWHFKCGDQQAEGARQNEVCWSLVCVSCCWFALVVVASSADPFITWGHLLLTEKNVLGKNGAKKATLQSQPVQNTSNSIASMTFRCTNDQLTEESRDNSAGRERWKRLWHRYASVLLCDYSFQKSDSLFWCVPHL